MARKTKTKEAVVDSPEEWVARHIRRYVESDGQKGGVYGGVPALLLTTRGRKTGQLRRTALYYGEDKGRYLLVASNGGAAKHPNWYLNLLDDPAVEVQVGAETFAARARPATPREKPRLWKIMAALFPQYDRYQAKTRRDIPLIIVERA
jgi:deazaflavin-dependent oxidoreductase (nitroreductase family)